MAKPVSRQVAIDGFQTEDDDAKEIEAGKQWRAALWSSLRLFCLSYIDARTGLKGYEGCAAQLDRRWGEEGRHVSGSLLTAALRDSERNYFRAEWLDWFASQSQEVADLLARRVKPRQTIEEYAAALENKLREYLSHKVAEKAIREARLG